MVLALPRRACATGLGGNGLDESVPFYIYAVLLSLACYVSYALVRRHERRRVLRSLDDAALFPPSLNDGRGFFGAIQVVVTMAATASVAAGFLPAVFFPILPLGYALIRRKLWLGVGLLVVAVVLSVPPFLVFAVVMLSV
jgi:hypothetical protein